MKRRRRRRRDGGSRTLRVVLLLTGLLVVASFAGALSSVSVDQAEVYRSGGVPVAEITSDQAAIGVNATASIQDGVNGQEFVTVSNRLDTAATYTVEITPSGAEGNVSFVSSSSVSVSGNGLVATVGLGAGESVTLQVDVASNASDTLDTADYVVDGGTDDGKVSVDLDERSGPDVVS